MAVPTLVTTVSTGVTSAALSITAPSLASVAIGNVIVVKVAVVGTAPGIPSTCTDTLGNTYTRRGSASAGNALVAIFTATATAAGASVVTVSGFTGTATRIDIVVEKWTGIGPLVIDGSPANYLAASGALTNASLPAIGLTRPNSPITAIVAFTDNGGSIGTGAGNTSNYTDNFTGAMGVSSEYRIYPNAGAAIFTNGINPNSVQEVMVGIGLQAVSLGPTITAQPTSKGVIQGSTVTFGLTATSEGTGLSYQWRKGGVNISLATSASYTTPVLGLVDDGGSYDCVVTDSYGTVTSTTVYTSVSATAVAGPAWHEIAGATVAGTANGPLVASAGGPATQTLTPGLFTNSQSFFAPTVANATGGAQTLTPSLYTNSQTFFAQTVGRGAVNLAPTRLTNTSSLFAPTVAVGAVALTPSLVTNAQTFPAPTVTRGAVTLAPSLLTNTQSFFGPTVAVGASSLAPSRVTNAQTFYGPSITVGPVTLTPGLFTNAQTFYSPTVGRGAITLTPALVSNAQTFYGATVAAGGNSLSAPFLTNSQTFFAPTVGRGAVTLTQIAFNRSNRIPNSVAAGAVLGVIGSGGAAPTGWSIGATVGVVREVVGVGSLPDGNPYVDIRWYGTNSSAATIFPDLYFAPTSLNIAASVGMTVSAGLYIEQIAGARTGFTSTTNKVSVGGWTAAGGFIEATGVTVTSGTRATVTRTLTGVASARTAGYVDMSVPASATVDITLRFSQPQLEYGTPTEYIPTSGTAVEAATVNQFFPASLGVLLAPSLLGNSQTFYGSTVTVGPATLSPPRLTNAQTFYGATVAGGVVGVAPALFTNSQTFFAPAVGRGTVTLTPTLLASSGSIFAPTLTKGAVNLSPPLFTSANTFYAATVGRGAISLLPTKLTNAQSFFAPSVGQITHTLAGNNVATATTSTSAAVTTAHKLTGVNVAQETTSTSGFAGHSLPLIGANVAQPTTSTSGAVTQTHALTGANAVQDTASTAGQITPVVALSGSDSSIWHESTAGRADQIHVLGGASTEQPTLSSVGYTFPYTLTPAIYVASVTIQGNVAKVAATAKALPPQPNRLPGRVVAANNRAVVDMRN